MYGVVEQGRGPGRHDDVSRERQQNLAGLLLLSNLLIGAVTIGIMAHFGWNPELTHFELLLLLVLVAISWINLFIAAGFVGWVMGLFPSLFADGYNSKDPERAARGLLVRRRMVFYYLGIWSNLLAFAVVTEVTGGLTESPFVALLIAFVLTGQQLSRFRTQSGLLFASGLLLALLMLWLDPLASSPSAAAPPELTVSTIILALTAGGLLNYAEKPHNYLLPKHVHPPSHARIYLDGNGTWRFSFYKSIHRQDPVLLRHRESAGVIGDGGFPDGLRERFEEYLIVMADEAGWRKAVPAWPARCAGSFVVALASEPEPPQ